MAIAGETQNVAVSPTPLAPNGPFAWMASTASFSIDGGQVVNAGDLVVGERRVRDLAGVEMHLLEHREAELHQRGAGNLRLDDPRIDRLAAVDDVDELDDPHVAGLGVDLDLGAGRRRSSRTASTFGVRPVVGSGGM